MQTKERLIATFCWEPSATHEKEDGDGTGDSDKGRVDVGDRVHEEPNDDA